MFKLVQVIALSACLLPAAHLAQAEDAQPVRFEADVQPILKTHCFLCHGDEEQPKAGLDLRLVRTMLKGGDSGPALTAGQPDESLIYQRIAAGEMPPGEKKLSDQERAVVQAWISQGAQAIRPEPDSLAPGAAWTEEERNFWSFQPVRRPPLPSVAQPELVRTPVDAFLLNTLEQEGFSFAPAADRATLIRRLSFDLLGLPPSPARVTAFVADESPDAYERLVDQLLASPTYGERWARHWLDVAGYADSDGYTDTDPERPWAFRYRDYVIRSFNADKPFDQFVVEQLAGDELLAPPYDNLDADAAEKLAATGLLRMAPDGTADGAVDQNTARNDVVAETIKIVSTSLLGLSVGCAQCHNHRYDPISQQDYYRFRAIFEPALDWKNWRPPGSRLVNLWTADEQQQAAKVDAELNDLQMRRTAEMDQLVEEVFQRELAKLDEGLREAARTARGTPAEQRSAEQQQILKDYPSLNVDGGSVYLYEPQRVQDLNGRYDKLVAETRAQRPTENMVACLTEPPGHAPTTYVFYRGDFNQPRQAAPPGELSVLGELGAQIPLDDPQLATTGRRLAWARHLTSGRHPLVGRVLVNRVWMHHFGRGLVATPGDFGVLGSRPSHPELLDWLAAEFVESGWQLKRLHRLLVNSTAYRQSSHGSEALAVRDPDNRLLGRMPVRRLEAEAIRDAILELSGSRTSQMFGPPVPVLPDEVGQIVVGKGMRNGSGIIVAAGDPGADAFRRSLYVQVRRSMPLGMLEPFDVAGTAPNCELRTSSTVAPQSLLLMNSAFVWHQAQRLAERVRAESGDDPAAQVGRAWRLAFGRQATESDVQSGVAFLEAQRTHFAAQPAAGEQGAQASAALEALASLCQALVCSNRFLYVD